MTKFEEARFSSPANSKDYVNNWERTFGRSCTFSEECSESRYPGDVWCEHHLKLTDQLPEKPETD